MAENAIGEEGAKEREGAKLGIPNAGEGAYDAAREGDEDPANEKEVFLVFVFLLIAQRA